MSEILGEILPYLPGEVSSAIEKYPSHIRKTFQEIRMKSGCPLLLISGTERLICRDVLVDIQDVEQTFRKICASSAYTHRNEIRSGYVTIPGGHRVGILGTAVLGEDGRVEGMREIYGLTFRIARDYTLTLPSLMNCICEENRIKNLLLLGPPCSGKTTVLRSVARELAQKYQVCVVDEREELFPSSRPVPVGCDVLRGFPKAVGILQGLRTLSPRVVVCDEIGTGEEVTAMLDGLRSGVSLVVSAHAYSVEEIFQRPPVRELFQSGGIDIVALLSPKKLGEVVEIKERKDLIVEMYHDDSGFSSVRGMRGSIPS